MKNKIIILCLSLIVFLPMTQPQQSVLFAIDNTYYRVTQPNAILYKDDALSSPMFYIEPSYFVKQITESNTSTLMVEYNDVKGYVNKSDLTKVNDTPTNPYPKATFKMNGSANAVLFSEPNNTSTFVGTVPYNATNIIFYGKIEGQEMLSNMGHIWYYCKYTSFEQGIILGYIYAPLTKDLTTIEPNTENFTDDVSKASVSPIENIIAPEIQDTNNISMIIGISVFAFFILFLALFKGKRKTKKAFLSPSKPQQTNNNLLEFNEKDDF